VVKFRVHDASNRKFSVATASYKSAVNTMRPKRVGNSIQHQKRQCGRHIKVSLEFIDLHGRIELEADHACDNQRQAKDPDRVG
jgi:hypothetical protein